MTEILRNSRILGNFFSFVPWLFGRRTPLDLATEAGRAAERHRRAVLSALASGAAKATSIVTSLISVPLALGYLGSERYGMWMTITSFTLMLSFADLGIGNGVLSAVARGHGRSDQAEIRRYISTAYIALSGLALLLMLIFVAIYPLVSWAALFNVTSSLAVADAGPAMAAFAATFVFSIPMSIIQRVQSGLQEGFLSSLWQCAAGVAALLAVLAAVLLRAHMIWLVIGFAAVPVFVGLVNTIAFFWCRPDLRPSFRDVDIPSLYELLSSGLLFFVLQISTAFAYASNAIIIAQTLGAAQVTSFAVPDRLFGMASLILQLMLTPLWPAYGEALARGDRAWLRRTLHRSFLLAVAVSGAFSLIMLLAGHILIRMWVGASVSVPNQLLLALAIWKVLEAAGYSVSMFLNGAGSLRIQAISGLLTAASAIALKVYLAKMMGVSGVVWASVMSFAVFGVPLIGAAVHKTLRSLREKERYETNVV
jgi:O-antigen/teichoic acid export membrane protein